MFFKLLRFFSKEYLAQFSSTSNQRLFLIKNKTYHGIVNSELKKEDRIINRSNNSLQKGLVKKAQKKKRVKKNKKVENQSPKHVERKDKKRKKNTRRRENKETKLPQKITQTRLCLKQKKKQ